MRGVLSTVCCCTDFGRAVASTPVSASGGIQDTLRQQVQELSHRVEELEQITSDTESNMVLVNDKVDRLTRAVANQEASFNKRLSDVLAQLQEPL